MTSLPVPAPFDTVLVANRGEIARRIIRTLKRMGIRSVAVYSDADATAPHVREADVAVRIGAAAATASYLSSEAVIAAALSTGAQAIHPGYGFLSENVDFAEACTTAGIAFIGPPTDAVRVMGDKIRAKAHVATHSVPVVAGFSAVGLTDDDIAAQASTIGYPLLIKPSAGGGGKGMEIVRSATELVGALASARRVARTAFSDDALLLERLIERPRHIEVQVLADGHGTTVHLGERECTLQRRHQKVIEESPSPFISADVRERLGAAAVAAAESVGYRGAGTVEFIAGGDRPDEFFFIEMNTRLQVEHPVTEAVTGIDLVEAQVRIAAGERLDFAQQDVRLHGHAIEARVYAESPARDFLPELGEIALWCPPRGVRVDSAIETGSVVGSDYDPMIAKVIAHAPDRSEAFNRLSNALRETVLFGVESNLAFLRDLVDDPDVRAGQMDTGLIERRGHFTDPTVTPAALAAAATALMPPAEQLWARTDGWRLNGPPRPAPVLFGTVDGAVHTAVSGVANSVTVQVVDDVVWAHDETGTWQLHPLTRAEASAARRAAADRVPGTTDPVLRAPMTGTVVSVHDGGDAPIAAGDRVLTIEAMKMEHHLLAPADGHVRISVAPGNSVRRDQPVAELLPAAANAAIAFSSTETEERAS